jgi:hypothetical protein
LPLADSDIFKAKIYGNYQLKSDRNEFTNTWKELTQVCKRASISIDDVFRYYSHVLRARNADKSKEVGLRKFYAEEKYKRLKDEKLMQEIMSLARFWLCINKGVEPDEEVGYALSTEAKKYIHCLSCYPNEFWKYATSVFFLKNKGDKNFDKNFCLVLKKLVAFLLAKFIEAPTVNAIKDDIYGACVSIQTKNVLQFNSEINQELISHKINELSSSRISRALLLLDAYLNPKQTTLIPETFDIEHIFPKKWQDTNYNGWNLEVAQFNLDRFGNKIVFEKKLNIQAGNEYFGAKKQKYSLSKIACVLELSNYPKNDWIKEDIEAREIIFKKNIIDFFTEQLI